MTGYAKTPDIEELKLIGRNVLSEATSQKKQKKNKLNTFPLTVILAQAGMTNKKARLKITQSPVQSPQSCCISFSLSPRRMTGSIWSRVRFYFKSEFLTKWTPSCDGVTTQKEK